ncbi:AMP-binding protein, partial [Candidatus Gracilibacteria bacterium]|nr:AMP-binding protein [Candidatus Gracilibacteria bacterium]
MIDSPHRALPRSPRSNPILNRADWEAQRAAFAADPGAFFATIARSAIHWYDPDLTAWIAFDEGAATWRGIDARSGQTIDLPYAAEHLPWQRTFEGDDPPFYRWFVGGQTNACFNEVDRHVLMGFGDEVAYYFEGDRWDSSLNGGRGGPVTTELVTRRQLLVEVVRAAQVLKNLGLKRGDRIALNMPNILPQIYYTEAAKRLGIIYTPVFGGFSDKTLSDRIHNAGARVVLTSDGGYRNAQIVAYKEQYTDQALDKFIPVETAFALVEQALEELQQKSGVRRQASNAEQAEDGVDAQRKDSAPSTLSAVQISMAHCATILEHVRAAIQDDITVERSDVMRGVGQALAALNDLDAMTQAQVRTAIARALVAAPPRVDAVVVVRHTGQDILWRPERDCWSHELLAEASEQLLANARTAGIDVQSEQELLALPDDRLVRALYASVPCTPLDSGISAVYIYTLGRHRKPKGVVHVPWRLCRRPGAYQGRG